MTAPLLSAEVAKTLKERHVAFLLERLTSETARAEWRAGFDDAYAEILARPIRDLVDPKTLLPALRRTLRSTAVTELALPIWEDLAKRTFTVVSKTDTALGTFVNPGAREAIDALMDRSDLLPEAVVRKVFEEEAIEEIIAAVLYDGLKEFNDTVNPFFADWGLPGLIKRVVPIGGGAVMKAIDALKGEFDKRLEPEIRKFIAAFTRRAKGKIADLVIAKAGDPHFVALRKNIARFLYQEKILALLAGFDEPARTELERAAREVSGELLSSDEAHAELAKGLDAFLREKGDGTVGDWLKAIGVSDKPDFTALADLTWPYAKVAVEGSAFRALVVRLADEFYDSLI